jgi:hypothetical protein
MPLPYLVKLGLASTIGGALFLPYDKPYIVWFPKLETNSFW